MPGFALRAMVLAAVLVGAVSVAFAHSSVHFMANAIPEPTMLLLLGVGSVMVLVRRRVKR
jgi:ABC-type Mn2+/Zn2+ transport system permease subunit